jgi:trigger factor
MTQASATERVLDIEIPRERLDKVFQDKLKKYGKSIKVNGFRPGAVPKAVIESKFREPIAAEALETLVDDAVREACKEQGIDPVGPGRVEKIENENGKPIAFKAIMEVDPPVELKNYKYEIPVNAAPVDEAAIEAQLEGIRRQIAKEVPVDRAAKAGDVVTARYTRIEVAGAEQPLPQYPTFRVEIGKGSVPELDKALEGVKSGDHKDVAFTFPADYSNPELAGRPSAYGLAIEQVLEVELPAFDDDFAKMIGYETAADARARMKERLQESAVRAAREAAWTQAIERLLNEHPIEVPKARVKNYVESRLKESGHVHDHDDHGHDHSDLEVEAVNQIRRWRLIEAIAVKENVKPDQEAVDARVRELALRYGTDFEGLKASLRKSGRILDIREEVKAEKTLDLVIGYKGSAA